MSNLLNSKKRKRKKERIKENRTKQSRSNLENHKRLNNQGSPKKLTKVKIKSKSNKMIKIKEIRLLLRKMVKRTNKKKNRPKRKIKNKIN